PNVADNYVIYVMSRLFVYVLVALGLNLLTGYTGQVSLGHAAFFAIGAYTAAVLAERWHWPSVLCLVGAALVSAAVGYLLGLPCLRLSGLYLAMATLGFTLIVQEMLLQLSVITHGSEGMKVQPASLLGSVLGACFLIVLPELLAGLDVWQALVYGLIMVVTIIFMPFGLSGALQRYAHRWFGIGVEPMIPRRLGH